MLTIDNGTAAPYGWAHLSQSTFIPIDSEIHDIRIRLALLRNELQRIQAANGANEAAADVTAMYEDKAILEKQALVLDASISLVRRLPSDILLEIFFHVLVDPASSSGLSYFGVFTQWHTSVMSVCKRWNILVLYTPTFWNSLRFPASRTIRDEPGPFRDGSAVEKLTEWVSRSQDCMLFLEIYENHEPLPLWAWKVLLSSAHRWETLCLCPAIPTLTMFSETSVMLPSLQKVSLQIRPNEGPHIKVVVETFLHAPKLHDVYFGSSRRSGASEQYDASIALPWTQLVRLDCSHDHEQLQTIRRLLPQLRELACRSAPQLHLFEAPSLMSLAIHYSLECSVVTAFIRRSRCQLEDLTLATLSAGLTADFFGLLDICPSLRKLHLQVSESAKPLWLYLSRKNAIPLLHTLVIQGNYEYARDPSRLEALLFLEMVLKRCSSGSPSKLEHLQLEFFALWSPSKPFDLIRSSLAELADIEGLYYSFKDSYYI